MPIKLIASEGSTKKWSHLSFCGMFCKKKKNVKKSKMLRKEREIEIEKSANASFIGGRRHYKKKEKRKKKKKTFPFSPYFKASQQSVLGIF